MSSELPESRVRQIWRESAGREDIETDAGPVKVLYPGRANDGRGADFREAVIRTESGLQTGDIEVHTLSSGWRAHGHHRDPVYNRVVLHVVYRQDAPGPVLLENGRSVPTVALEKLPAPDPVCLNATRRVPCQASGAGKGGPGGVLDAAGEQRFQSRVAGFQTIASPVEAGQALYRGIMGALGYRQNKFPMLALACRMPLRRLETIVTGDMPGEECLAACQALLTGTAGLLPSQRAPARPEKASDPGLDRLEGLWRASREKAAMSASDWHFFRVRPGNLPVRRIAAMACLLLRYREEGLLAGLLGEVEKLPAGGNPRGLENALLIRGKAAGKSEGARLGSERAAGIVINVLLPFAVAWGRLSENQGLAGKAADLYGRYPALQENSIEGHMRRQLGLDKTAVNTARRQQGLLHIFQTFCARGGCRDCPAGRA